MKLVKSATIAMILAIMFSLAVPFANAEEYYGDDVQAKPVKKAHKSKNKLEQIDEKILKYEQEKNTGITCFWVGLAAEALSFVFLPSTTYTYDSNWNVHTEESGNAALYYGLLAGGGVTTLIGAYMWYEGANGIQIWESKKVDVSMGIVLPNSISSKNTIGIKLTAKF